jgi:hypothetical protein
MLSGFALSPLAWPQRKAIGYKALDRGVGMAGLRQNAV